MCILDWTRKNKRTNETSICATYGRTLRTEFTAAETRKKSFPIFFLSCCCSVCCPFPYRKWVLMDSFVCKMRRTIYFGFLSIANWSPWRKRLRRESSVQRSPNTAQSEANVVVFHQIISIWIKCSIQNLSFKPRNQREINLELAHVKAQKHLPEQKHGDAFCFTLCCRHSFYFYTSQIHAIYRYCLLCIILAIEWCALQLPQTKKRR